MQYDPTISGLCEITADHLLDAVSLNLNKIAVADHEMFDASIRFRILGTNGRRREEKYGRDSRNKLEIDSTAQHGIFFQKAAKIVNGRAAIYSLNQPRGQYRSIRRHCIIES
jgi:hypothetical protein